ncbi:MAG: WecB/TagA/CpsF family glycosyltransferase [Thiohalocapsa sp.]|uniref:WecB/TagA/CpsF family glycosyltransferase n=1 Tax=Thiohalocapsa sp. TaxID=2497641 RepID=UPI0025FC0013|nr:WecB/TagA/CpsF family glycosyltransferase [Thiohalocapsa sp.]MCG6942391.1 WecB/TagA/CpsF family glycosyltransferase [Thiohalocapsa sp.]
MGRQAVKIPGPLGQRGRGRRRLPLRRTLLPAARFLGDLLPRLLDMGLAAALLLVISPLLLARGVASVLQTGRLFDFDELIGRCRTRIHRLRFAGSGPLKGLAVWFSVLKGDLALVGPRPLSPAEAAAVPVADAVRFSVRPGLVTPFGVKRQVGIAHLGESRIDRDFVYAQSVKGDLGLAARSMVTGVLGGGAARETPPLLNFFGIPILNTSMAEAVDWLMAVGASGHGAARQLAFVNPDCLNIAWHDAEYRAVLLAAARVLPDGIGIHIGCRMQGVALRENVNGTDLFPLLCAAAAERGRSLFLLGARPGIAASAAERMQRRYPKLRIAGTRDGYFDVAEEPAVIEQINASGADLLLVAFGAPRQDVWLHHHRDALAPPVRMGVGGLFDFYSGRIPRAPVWMREIGLEWVYRLLQEPGRMWRRYVIGNPLFLYRVWRQMLSPERFALPPERVPATTEPTP